MQDVETKSAHGHAVALVEPAVRRHGSGFAEPVIGRRLRQGIEEELVGQMRALHRHAEALAQLVGAGRVIDMAVGQQDFLDLHALLTDRRLDPVEVAAGIDDSADLGGFVPDQGAILLEGRDRDDPGAGRTWHGVPRVGRAGFGAREGVLAQKTRCGTLAAPSMIATPSRAGPNRCSDVSAHAGPVISAV